MLIAFSLGAMAQTKPRKHITYEINKIEHVTYLPDTIPIFFKELVVTPDTVIEKWQNGFVVWQTFTAKTKGSTVLSGETWNTGGSPIYLGVDDKKEYWENIYKPSPPEHITGKFLYSDYTKVKNQVIYTMNRADSTAKATLKGG